VRDGTKNVRGRADPSLRLVQTENDEVGAHRDCNFDDLVCLKSVLNPAIRLAPQIGP
jgi:hypothetical protein